MPFPPTAPATRTFLAGPTGYAAGPCAPAPRLHCREPGHRSRRIRSRMTNLLHPYDLHILASVSNVRDGRTRRGHLIRLMLGYTQSGRASQASWPAAVCLCDSPSPMAGTQLSDSDSASAASISATVRSGSVARIVAIPRSSAGGRLCAVSSTKTHVSPGRSIRSSMIW